MMRRGTGSRSTGARRATSSSRCSARRTILRCSRARQYDLHGVTPEDEDNTHYFFCTRRNHIEDDADYNAMKIGAMHGAFEDEDGPLMIACEREMGGEDFFDLKPMLLSNDLAAVKVRRRLRDLVMQELAGGSTST